MGQRGTAAGSETGPDPPAPRARWQFTAVVVAVWLAAFAIDDDLRDAARRLHAAAAAQLHSDEPHRSNLVTPRAGERALSEPVLRMVEMLRDNGVESFSLSTGIDAQPFVRQRLIEGAWPIRFDPTARDRVAYLAEEVRCAAVDRRGFESDWRIPRRQRGYFHGKRGVQLVRCP